MEEEGQIIFRELRIRRIGRVLMYAGLVASGILAFFFPSELIAEQVSYPVEKCWAIMMAVSSAVCLFGSLTDRWIGEYAGLPSLSAVLAVYGCSAILSSPERSVALLAYGIVCVSFAFGLLSRWRDVQDIKKANDGFDREGE